MNVPAKREHRIVVGVDCTPRSVELLRWADHQALLTGARLIAVTGWRIELLGLDPADTVIDVQAHTRHLLAETIRAALPPERARTVQLRVMDIAPADALVAESMTADLVVVGPHSAHAIEGLLLGSVTEHVLSQANCPVAVVHDTTLAQRHRIVVGLDGSDCSRRALDWAIQRATLTDATVDAILAWQWTPQYGVYPFGPDEATVEKAAQHLLDSELARLPAATRGERARPLGSRPCREGPARRLSRRGRSRRGQPPRQHHGKPAARLDQPEGRPPRHRAGHRRPRARPLVTALSDT